VINWEQRSLFFISCSSNLSWSAILFPSFPKQSKQLKRSGLEKGWVLRYCDHTIYNVTLLMGMQETMTTGRTCQSPIGRGLCQLRSLLILGSNGVAPEDP
jgi:hypothetical protein